MTVASPSDTTTRLAESIASLPPLPETAQKILTCFGDEFIDAHKVTAVVEGDPGICARLLGLANSAYFGLAEPVSSIGEAISRVLGVDTVRSLVLAMAIQQSFNSRGCPAFSTERFWLQSLTVAECAKKIALADEQSSDVVRDLAYSAGLCHNLGLMALVHMQPERCNRVLTAHKNQGLPDTLSAFFDSEFETDHTSMTAELARIWSLPEPMVNAYLFRTGSDGDSRERLGLVIAAAVIAVENAEVTGDEQPRSLATLGARLGIEEDDLQAMGDFGDRQRERVQSLAKNMTR